MQDLICVCLVSVTLQCVYCELQQHCLTVSTLIALRMGPSYVSWMLLQFADCGYEVARLCMAVDGHGNQRTGQLGLNQVSNMRQLITLCQCLWLTPRVGLLLVTVLMARRADLSVGDKHPAKRSCCNLVDWTGSMVVPKLGQDAAQQLTACWHRPQKKYL
jgi:hypothetical protein